MTKINNRKVKEIGRYLYTDAFGKMYILNAHRDAYLMLDAREQRIFQLLRLRFVIAMLAGFLFHYYASSVLPSLCLGIAIFLILQLVYRFWFLPSLIQVSGKVESVQRGWMENLTLSPLSAKIKLAVLSGVIALFFLYNFVTMYVWPTLLLPQDGESFLTWGFYIAMVLGAGIVCVLSIVCLFKDRKEN